MGSVFLCHVHLEDNEWSFSQYVHCFIVVLPQATWPSYSSQGISRSREKAMCWSRLWVFSDEGAILWQVITWNMLWFLPDLVWRTWDCDTPAVWAALLTCELMRRFASPPSRSFVTQLIYVQKIDAYDHHVICRNIQSDVALVHIIPNMCLVVWANAVIIEINHELTISCPTLWKHLHKRLRTVYPQMLHTILPICLRWVGPQSFFMLTKVVPPIQELGAQPTWIQL